MTGAASHERIREFVLGATPTDDEVVAMAHEIRELRRVYRAALALNGYLDQGCCSYGSAQFAFEAALELAKDFTLPVVS